MRFDLTPMTRADTEHIRTWHYDGPYVTYDPGDDVEDMLDPRSPFFVARDELGEIVGFCCFGTAAEIGVVGPPRLYSGEERVLSVGLGLRPDLTGHGVGLSFMRAILAFGRARFTPDTFRLFVLTWNWRARRVYERAGFTPQDIIMTPYGAEFLEMRLERPEDAADGPIPLDAEPASDE